MHFLEHVLSERLASVTFRLPEYIPGYFPMESRDEMTEFGNRSQVTELSSSSSFRSLHRDGNPTGSECGVYEQYQIRADELAEWGGVLTARGGVLEGVAVGSLAPERRKLPRYPLRGSPYETITILRGVLTQIEWRANGAKSNSRNIREAESQYCGCDESPVWIMRVLYRMPRDRDRSDDEIVENHGGTSQVAKRSRPSLAI